MKIGVFDSGIGGLSVANAIKRAVPGNEIVFKNDPEHMPYGDKTPQQLLELAIPIFRLFEVEGCDAIVIACNTVSTLLAPQLREIFDTPIVALEPMVKPAAAHTKSGVIAVCATPATLASKRYSWLKTEYAKSIEVLEPDCREWARMIEADTFNRGSIAGTIQDVLARHADVIVLGCTHYHWIEDDIRTLAAGKATILQPEQAVVAQLKRVLAQLA